MLMPFVTKPPPLPKDSKDGIGIFVHNGYDSRHIKVFQDIVLSVISNNRSAKYVIHSSDTRCNLWANEYLSIYHIPHHNIIFIDPKHPHHHHHMKNEFNIADRDKKTNRLEKPELEERRVFFSKNALTLQTYKEAISKFDLDSVYVFTDNPKATEILELINAGEVYNFKVYTITSDGDYEDHSDPNNPKNHKAMYGGIYRNEHLKKV